MHADQVAVEDAVVDHGVALHFQQVVGSEGEQRAVQPQLLVQADVGADRDTGRHPSQHRQRHQLAGPAAADQADAAFLAGSQFDQAVGDQGLHVFLGGIARGEAEFGGNLGQAGRPPLPFDPLTKEGQHGGAFGRECP